MKTSNWLIAIVLAIASVFFLWLWYYLQFNLVHPLDLVLTIGWWVIVLLIVTLIQRSEKKRQERVRTCYVGPSSIFNSEAGLVPLEQGTPSVEAVQSVLENLSYNFDLADFPEEDEARFDYMVKTKKFKAPAKDASQDEPEANEPKAWEGEVIFASAEAPEGQEQEKPQTKSFSNKEELAQLLGGAPAAPTAPFASVPSGA